MILENLSWKQVNDLDADTALFPIGSTEQHGPHMALKTDSVIAENIAREASKRIKDKDRDKNKDKDKDKYKDKNKTKVVCLPTLEFGISEEHRSFEGTLWISHDTLREFVTDVFRSLENSFENIIVVNGHGGNVSALNEVCAKFSRSSSLFATEWIWWRALSLQKELGHGGKLETSLMLHLAPELVDKEKAKKGSETWGKRIEGSETLYDVDEFTETGVIGDPTKATEKRGKEVFELSVESLCKLIEELN